MRAWIIPLLFSSFFLMRIIPDIPIVPPEGVRYVFNGLFQTEKHCFYYGTAASGELTTEYKGLLVIVDPVSKTVEKTVLFETGYLETILFMGGFDDETFFLVLERYYTVPPSPSLKTRDVLILKVDGEGTVLDEYSIPRHMRAFHQFGSYLFVEEQSLDLPVLIFDSDLKLCTLPITEEVYAGVFDFPFQGEATVNGDPVEKIRISIPGEYQVEITDGTYTLDFAFTLLPLISGVEAGGEYTTGVTIESSCPFLLNGEKQEGPLVVSTPGYYRLLSIGTEETLDFTIHPVVETLYSGYISSDPVRIFSNGTVLHLNQELISPGTLVSEPGLYLLEIEGVNGYVLTVSFEIVPSVKGLVAEEIYADQVTFTINGVATLNGMRVNGNTVTLTEPNDYELILWQGSVQYQTIAFRVVSSITETVEEETDFVPILLDTILGIFVLVGLFLVLKKK